MRVLVLAMCLAAGAALVPAGAFAADPGSAHQSNRNVQQTVVDNRGAQSAGLIAGSIVVPVNVAVGANVARVRRGQDVTQSNSNEQTTVVDNSGAQSAGLVAGPILVPVNGLLGLNLGL
jgi:hypothetical protein